MEKYVVQMVQMPNALAGDLFFFKFFFPHFFLLGFSLSSFCGLLQLASTFPDGSLGGFGVWPCPKNGTRGDFETSS